MGGKSSGGFDASAAIQYGDRALDIQEDIYNENKQYIQPYYDTGLSGLEMLSNMMGIGSSREQLYNELAPSYTTETTSTTGGMGGQDLYIDENGQLTTQPRYIGDVSNAATTSQYNTPFSTNETVTNSEVDLDGLNAAIAAEMEAEQSADGFGSLMQTFGMDQFEADPGYQFRLDEGQKALERAAAARGQYYDPSTVKALSEYNANMADQTYMDSYNRYNNDQTNMFNRLASMAGIGQTATGQLTGVGNNYSNAASQTLGSVGSAVQSAANANASQPSMFDTLLSTGAQLGTAYFMSDIRMKENIEYIGKENGFNTYKFNYKGGDKQYIGVMAQEVEKVKPEAVMELSGIKHVDYDQIGIEMREV